MGSRCKPRLKANNSWARQKRPDTHQGAMLKWIGKETFLQFGRNAASLGRDVTILPCFRYLGFGKPSEITISLVNNESLF